MTVKVSVTDLQTRATYRGSLKKAEVAQGKNLEIALDDKPGYAMRIAKIRGWLTTEPYNIYYIISGAGKRYKVSIIKQTAIDSKQ